MTPLINYMFRVITLITFFEAVIFGIFVGGMCLAQVSPYIVISFYGIIIVNVSNI